MGTKHVRIVLLVALIVLSANAVLPDFVRAETHLVLNEVELDPPRAARQWVELYNPTAGTIDLTDWTITSSGLPETKISVIDPGRSTYDIDPGDYYVFEYVRYTLAKSNETVNLRDRWSMIDRAPSDTVTFNDTYHDDRTWSRYPNGVDTGAFSDWRFISSTSGASNDLSPTVFRDTITVLPGKYDYNLSMPESVVKRDYPASTVLTDSSGDLLFNVTLTGVRWGFRIYIPPEFGMYAAEPWVVWTGATNDYNAVYVSKTARNDPIAADWWLISIEPVDNPVDRNKIGLPIPRLMPPTKPSIDKPYSFYVRVFNVRAPSIAGRYFFKGFVLLNGTENYASIGAGNFPTLVVKSSLNPAYVSGTIRYSGLNPSLYGQPIRVPGRVTAEGSTPDGRVVRGIAYFNASANGAYTLYGLAAGTYTLTAIAKGFRSTVLETKVKVNAGQSLEGADIYIIPGLKLTQVVQSKDCQGTSIPWGTERSITVKLLNSAKAELISVSGTTSATAGSFIYTFWYMGDLDGHVPQSFSDYISGVPPGVYYLNSTVSDYIQREFFQISLTNEHLVGASMQIDLFNCPAVIRPEVTFAGNLEVTVFSVNWQTPVAHIPWAYNKKHITVVIYNAMGEESSSLVLHQDGSRTNVAGFIGGLLGGSYFVRAFTPGYIQLSTPTVYVNVNGTADISVNLVKAPVINLTIFFRTENIYQIVTRKTGNIALNFYGNFTPIRVEVYSADDRFAGANITYVPPETYIFNMSVIGFDGYAGNPATRNWGGWVNYFDATDGRLQTDLGLPPGTYTIKVWVPGYIQSKMAVVELKLGQTATVPVTLDRMAHLKGRFSASGVGWLDMWDNLKPNSWSTITVRNSLVLVTYPLDGDFDIWLPAGNFAVVVDSPPYGFLPKQAVNVTLSLAWETHLTFTMAEPRSQLGEFGQSNEFILFSIIAIISVVGLTRGRRSPRLRTGRSPRFLPSTHENACALRNLVLKLRAVRSMPGPWR